MRSAILLLSDARAKLDPQERASVSLTVSQSNDMATPSDQAVRTFWHGSPLSAYQLLCLRSFVDRGHAVEVFSYDPSLAVPNGVLCRDADEIWPTDRVMHYQIGFGTGSPSLHSDLFRYAMLYRLGGWWIDMDVVLLRTELPEQPIYFARENTEYIVTGTLKFPPRHDLLADCVRECAKVGETATWGQTGSRLFEPLVKKYGLEPLAQTYETTYPIPWRQIAILFDPARAEEVGIRCAHASFLHLYNEIWRQSQIPLDLRPPEGSYLDMLVTRHGIDIGSDRRMDFHDIARRLT
jgi:hypothetical protein